jgi:hypothetical protein
MVNRAHDKLRDASIKKRRGLSREAVSCTGPFCDGCAQSKLMLDLWFGVEGPPAKRFEKVAQQINLAFSAASGSVQ